MGFKQYAEANAPTAAETALFEAQQQRQQEIWKQEKGAAENATAPAERTPDRESRARARRLLDEVAAGARAGDNMAGLLLKAVEAAGLLACRPEIAATVDESLKTVYGQALHNPAAAGLEVAEREQRLQLLEEALNTATPSEAQLIRRSIKANKKRLRELEKEQEAGQIDFEEVTFDNDPF